MPHYVVSTFADGTLRVWNVADQRTVAFFITSDGIQSVTVSPIGNAIAVGSKGGSFYLLSLEESQVGSSGYQGYSDVSPQVEVRFQVHAETQWGQSVYLVGNNPFLKE